MAKEESDQSTVAWNTPVPSELSDQALELMRVGGFNSKAEFVRALMREKVERSAQDELEAKLLRAMERSNFTEATPAFWKKLRAEVLGGD